MFADEITCQQFGDVNDLLKFSSFELSCVMHMVFGVIIADEGNESKSNFYFSGGRDIVATVPLVPKHLQDQ